MGRLSCLLMKWKMVMLGEGVIKNVIRRPWPCSGYVSGISQCDAQRASASSFFKIAYIGTNFFWFGVEILVSCWTHFCIAEPALWKSSAACMVMSPFLSKWPVLLFMFIGSRAVQEALFKQIRWNIFFYTDPAAICISFAWIHTPNAVLIIVTPNKTIIAIREKDTFGKGFG